MKAITEIMMFLVVLLFVFPVQKPSFLRLNTEAEYLRQALEEENLIEGEEGAYGLWVITVAERTADIGKEEWWSLYKNGEFSFTGVDDTPLKDGDSFEYRVTVGYDESEF